MKRQKRGENGHRYEMSGSIRASDFSFGRLPMALSSSYGVHLRSGGSEGSVYTHMASRIPCDCGCGGISEAVVSEIEKAPGHLKKSDWHCCIAEAERVLGCDSRIDAHPLTTAKSGYFFPLRILHCCSR